MWRRWRGWRRCPGWRRTATERALFTPRRKQAYEALHPETVNGASGVSRPKVRQVGEAISETISDLPAADRFTADTAAKTGTALPSTKDP